MEALQTAITEGLNSGPASALDMDAIKRKARQEAAHHENNAPDL